MEYYVSHEHRLSYLLLKITFTIGVIGFLGLLIQAFNSLILNPRRLRSKIQKQGIRGPRPEFLLGNIREIRKLQSARKYVKANDQDGDRELKHDMIPNSLFPFFKQWTEEYGSTFLFSLGNIQILHTTDPEIVKEISTCTSLDFGKPSYQQKDRGPILGQGILTSNGALWAHQRKVLAPEFYMEKVKGMVDLMVESSMILVDSWTKKINDERNGGVVDINIGEYMRIFSGEVISRACFGSSYSRGEEIFNKLWTLQHIMSKKALFSGIPILRYLPTKSNRDTWKLEKEVKELILDVVKERKESTHEMDLLQLIIDGATNNIELISKQEDMDRFVVDNCKNIYLAGYETNAVASSWTLMLLASSPEWQEKVRAEVFDICKGQLPNSDMIRQMKILNMVIHESLRLYPPVCIISREVLKDMKFGNIQVAKGVNVWTMNVTLHLDPEIWGPDAHKFNPQRFANGVSGACKAPHVYMPFGAGPRSCLGQNFALAELKILIATIVSNFQFSLSPKYVHSPAMRLVTEPEHGVHLLVKKL